MAIPPLFLNDEKGLERLAISLCNDFLKIIPVRDRILGESSRIINLVNAPSEASSEFFDRLKAKMIAQFESKGYDDIKIQIEGQIEKGGGYFIPIERVIRDNCY